MLTGLTLNTNIVKVRSNVYDAMEMESTAGVTAGGFQYPNVGAACCGIATEDITAGQSGLYVFQADDIVVPCELDSGVVAGQPAYLHGDFDCVTDATTSGFIVGVFREALAGTATEIRIKLFGFLLPVVTET